MRIACDKCMHGCITGFVIYPFNIRLVQVVLLPAQLWSAHTQDVGI